MSFCVDFSAAEELVPVGTPGAAVAVLPQVECRSLLVGEAEDDEEDDDAADEDEDKEDKDDDDFDDLVVPPEEPIETADDFDEDDFDDDFDDDFEEEWEDELDEEVKESDLVGAEEDDDAEVEDFDDA